MARMEIKQNFVKRIKKLNPNSEVLLDNQGFIRMKRTEESPFKLPRGCRCEEGNDCIKNSITLRHIYSGENEFIVTLIVYQNS